MNRQDFLRLVRKEIHFIFDRKSIEKELSEHLDDSVEYLMEEGLSRDEAEHQAIAQMGEPSEIGKLLDKEHHPILGYMWMISKLMVIAAIVVMFVKGFDDFQSALDLLYPSQNIGWRIEESHPIRMQFETKTHDITIDHICLTEYGDYYLTYRAKKKFEYVKSSFNGTVIDLGFDSQDREPEVWSTSLTNGRFGEKGYIMFDWPDDDIVYLHSGNRWNQGSQDAVVVKLNLEEYWR